MIKQKRGCPLTKTPPQYFPKFNKKNLPNIPQIKRQRPNPFPRQMGNSVAQGRSKAMKRLFQFKDFNKSLILWQNK
jgi:hypothetical protein